MPNIRFALASLLLANPGALAAQCPTEDDLAEGIRFGIADGAYETFTRQSDNTLAAIYGTQDGPESRVLLARGMYLSEVINYESGALDPSSRLVYGYAMPLDALPTPSPNGSARISVTVNESGKLSQETHIYDFGPEATVNYGPCAYKMIPAEVRYEPSEDDAVDYLEWLPELGLSYLVRSRWDAGDERYEYLSISVAD